MAVCTVSTIIRNASGETVNAVAIDFYAAAPQGVGTASVLVADRIRVVSGPTAENPGWAAGYVEIDLERESLARLRCPRLGIWDVVVTIPDSATANLSTLLEAAL
jgi:hypothetical protein